MRDARGGVKWGPDMGGVVSWVGVGEGVRDVRGVSCGDLTWGGVVVGLGLQTTNWARREVGQWLKVSNTTPP